MIGIGLGPSAPQRCTPELLEETIASWRASATSSGRRTCSRRGRRPTPRGSGTATASSSGCAERGLLGPEATLVHTVWLSDSDIELMSAAGTHRRALPAQQPSAGRRGRAAAGAAASRRPGRARHRRPRVRRDARHARADEDDRLRPQGARRRLARLADRPRRARDGDRGGQRLYRPWRDPRTDRAGRARRPDLLPRNSPAFTPLHDPVRQLVYGAPSRDIRDVVVDGRVVVRDGAWSESTSTSCSRRLVSSPRRSSAASAVRMPKRSSARRRDVSAGRGAELDVDSYIPS